VPAIVAVIVLDTADVDAGLRRRRRREARVELDQLRVGDAFMAAFDYVSVSV
jgi:hypothetical protein